MQAKGVSEVPATGDPARIEDAHAALRAESSIQFDLPGPPPQPTVDFGFLDWLFDLFEGSGEGFRVGLWVLFGALILFLLFLLFRWLDANGVFGRTRAGAAAQAEGWRPEEAPARALLEEADRLAAEGRYAEAAHLLLFRSIEDIEARKPDLVRPALTSRDIAGAPAIPAGPRRAFGEIVLMVERSLFGGRSLDGGDWGRCRAAYEEFAFAAEWGR